MTLITQTLDAAARAFHVPVADILSATRLPLVSAARRAVYVALRANGLSLHQAAEACGRTDHTTVLHAEREHMRALTQPEYAVRYAQVVAAAGTDHTPPADGLAGAVAYLEQWQPQRTRIRMAVRGVSTVDVNIAAMNTAVRELLTALKEVR